MHIGINAVRTILIASLGTGMVACGSDATGIANPDQTPLWATMSVHAVTMSMGTSHNTVQLSVTAYRGNGDILTEGVTTFTASDETLTVTADGLVTAHAETINSNVVAKVTYQGVTVSDTTWISVTPDTNPVPLETFSITPPSGMIPIGERTNIAVTAYDMDGNDLSLTIPVYFTTSDPAVAKVDRYKTFLAEIPERAVTVYATTTVYGVTRTDSFQVMVGYPTSVFVTVASRTTSAGESILVFLPSTIYVAPGGSIVFCNCQVGGIKNVRPIDVVFDQPDAAKPGTGSGNIPPWMATPDDPYAVFQSRMFPTAGTYTFKSDQYGSTGTIIVR